MENIIKIKNAVFYAYHGVMSEEQVVGGKFECDVDIYTSFADAAKNDDLTKTVDYSEVYKFIQELVHERKFYLIETLAIHIADKLKHHFEDIHKVTVRVRKHNVPIGGVLDYVEAEVTK
ncbi:MAG: dihydroneopterin aldolase [Melioribacteraceae bacterium]|nr:dihydroneopterin aldolase [Melioribacteraceae bacterium]